MRIVDCRSPQTRYLQPPQSILLDVSKPVGDPVLNDVGPRVDIQLGLGVLLPLLTAFTLWSFSAISTSTVSKRLMGGADFGDFVLELVGDLDLEGPSVGGESGLGVQLCFEPSQLGSSCQSPRQRCSWECWPTWSWQLWLQPG